MYEYSPRPIHDYFVPGLNGTCEAGALAKLDRSGAAWNLFWLSVPIVDNLLDSDGSWFHLYVPTAGVAAALAGDVCLDDALSGNLVKHPADFQAWFRRQDQSTYSGYSMLGGQAWVNTVLVRAHQAAQRIGRDSRGARQ